MVAYVVELIYTIHKEYNFLSVGSLWDPALRSDTRELHYIVHAVIQDRLYDLPVNP